MVKGSSFELPMLLNRSESFQSDSNCLNFGLLIHINAIQTVAFTHYLNPQLTTIMK